MIGCYAQTELGHGSNVRALETTAMFKSEQDGGMKGGSWIINSPTLTSTKFWPGTLGRTANHAMVIARLIDGDGIDRGIHNFLVPLRSMKDHKLLKGVKTGDIGPKIGYNVMDNGYASFDGVEIPRRNMAMRFSQVDEQGKYKKTAVSPAASKIAYITMMQVRALIVMGSGKALAQACTITIRYSAVRKQGFAQDGKSELQILDYTQQQHRLFPLLAASYCFHFCGQQLLKNLKRIEGLLLNGKKLRKPQVADIHASSSALKSYCTTVAADGIEDARKACGGHGFLACSGLPELLTTYLQSPTVEGDNHMLPQQVIKVLLKLVQAVQSGDESSIQEYETCDSYTLVPSLKKILGGEEETCVSDDLTNLDTLLLAFRHRAALILVDTAQHIQTQVMQGKPMQEAWNSALVRMAAASRAYAQFIALEDFLEGIADAQKTNQLGSNEVGVMQDLATLLALYWMEQDMGGFLEDGYLTAAQANQVRDNVLQYLERVRPNAVALVDARDISDFRLKSALGRYDGNVYPFIMKAAMKDPLNAVDPGPAYDPELKRLIAGGAGVYSGTASRL